MKKLLFALVAVVTVAAQAEMLDRPNGIRIGRRTIIRPYVSLYYTWDSNVDMSTQQGSYSSFNISPGFTAAYTGENWSIDLGAYYQYHGYTDNPDNLNENAWGENLSFNWSNTRDGGRGWSFVLRESFQMISQDDDMTNDGGRGMGRDRYQLQFATSLQRRFTDRWHADVNATYYYIDYLNDTEKYAPLYGWTRWTAGAQVGYAASRWTDIIITGNYQGYTQQNDAYPGELSYHNLSQNSQGGTIHLGLGSYATERISYRVTGGYSVFKYSDGDDTVSGFTYTASGHWRMTDRWNMMLLASSYYHPSETEYGAATRTDAISWGLSHSMIRDKLIATLDLCFHADDRVSTVYAVDDMTEYVLTARLGLNYSFNRFVGIFGHCEYQTSLWDGDALSHNQYDYDRWRLTIGLRLTY